MSNIIGPISLDDWLLLRTLRSTISWMKRQDDRKNFEPGIKMETEIYNETKEKYVA